MSETRFWQPDQLSKRRLIVADVVPVIGMILGNAISSVGVGWTTVQKEFIDNRDRVETYLA